jgi:hypothetical protein
VASPATGSTWPTSPRSSLPPSVVLMVMSKTFQYAAS